ncbi:MAG TPA: calcium-binding protein [Casimicrobiaceae bacterium]|nr:calcium-binding protein [Casimicrobiaceae bacterium]
MDDERDATANPPLDYAVAVWLGMPDAEVERGLAEGWIRRPTGAGEGGQPASDGVEQASAQVPAVPGAATLRGWLTRLAPAADGAAFETMWWEAGSDDARRAQTLQRFVAAALGVPHDAAPSTFEAALDGFDGEAHVVRLAGRSGAELEAMAREDAGVRRALADHSPWAWSGNRVAHAHADGVGRFDRFDPDTGEQRLTDAWVGDRARHASWRLHSGARTVDGDGWRFVDRAAPEADVVLAGGDGRPVHQVVFARDGGDAVTGGATTDRVHGGDGDDVLRGRAGDDLLEGNAGADLIVGGAGRDDIAGGSGDDELDGGAGSDRLRGDSGNDELSGGRGNDFLAGGRGDDVYAFEAGDGIDVVDDDGGVLRIAEVEVRGAMQRDGERWRSADGTLAFELAGDDGDGTLRVRYGEGASVELRGWRQGRYGITLQGLQAEGDGAMAGGEALSSAVDEGRRDAAGEHDAFGNEGSDGRAPAMGTPDSDVAALFGEGDVGTGDALPWVDRAALRAAMEAWSVPAPPDVTDAQDVGSPTVADIAEAAAGDGAADDADETASGGQAAWNTQAWRTLWGDAPMPSPPDLVLRRPS